MSSEILTRIRNPFIIQLTFVFRGPPYNIQVDVPALLAPMKTKAYTTDIDFWQELLEVVHKANDGHFLITTPGCYKTIIFALPLMFVSAMASDTQQIKLSLYSGNLHQLTLVNNFFNVITFM